MKTHRLKTYPKPFNDLVTKIKSFEIRINDRNFEVGDKLVLEEYLPEHNQYTGKTIIRWIQYIIQGEFGLPDNLAVLGLCQDWHGAK